MHSTTNRVKSTKLRWAGNVAEMGELRDVHGILVETPFHKRQLGRPKGWENNIKWGLKVVGTGSDSNQMKGSITYFSMSWLGSQPTNSSNDTQVDSHLVSPLLYFCGFI
jgi:Zn-dependent M16 (insulinase) family peptidase